VGRFEAEHALVVGQILAHVDFLDEAIERLSAAIEEQIAPFAPQRELLKTIPGVNQRTAEVLISEIGVDMSAFPTPKHLASWAGVCPGNDQSAGKRRSGKTRKGSKWLRATLTESAAAATPKPSPPSATRSSLPPGTGSKPASCTEISGATTSPDRTPTASPDVSSANSKRSATMSRSNPRRSAPDGDFATAGANRSRLAHASLRCPRPDGSQRLLAHDEPHGSEKSRDQSGYSSLRQARGSSDSAFGVRLSRNELYGATNGSGAITE
jgi:Transposase IS116/IS110/IS902 family